MENCLHPVPEAGPLPCAEGVGLPAMGPGPAGEASLQGGHREGRLEAATGFGGGQRAAPCHPCHQRPEVHLRGLPVAAAAHTEAGEAVSSRDRAPYAAPWSHLGHLVNRDWLRKKKIKAF